MDGGEEGVGIFGIPCCDAPPAFEMEEGVFDQMSEAVQVSVVLPGFAAIAFGRDHRFHFPLEAMRHDRIGVISPVRQQGVGVYALDQDTSLAAIRGGTCCNNRSDRHTMRIHGQM